MQITQRKSEPHHRQTNLGKIWNEVWHILSVTTGQKPRCSNMITNHLVNKLSCRMQPKAIDAKNRFTLRTGQQHSSLLV
jgi:hypothetical protein